MWAPSELGMHSSGSLYNGVGVGEGGMRSPLAPGEPQAVLLAVRRHISVLFLNQ